MGIAKILAIVTMLPIRVLVVDDDNQFRSALEMLLTREGCEVSGASDGRKALELVEEGTFDAVVTDLRMPGMGGRELVQRLRKTHPNMGVVAVTAVHDLGESIARETGVEVLEKPVRRETLLAALRKVGSTHPSH